jgi:hypothetical protein
MYLRAQLLEVVSAGEMVGSQRDGQLELEKVFLKQGMQ